MKINDYIVSILFILSFVFYGYTLAFIDFLSVEHFSTMIIGVLAISSFLFYLEGVER